MNKTLDLYDKLIEQLLSSVAVDSAKRWGFDSSQICKKCSGSPLILSKDAAYELGGSALPAIGSTLFSTDSQISDSVILFGKDIFELNRDTAYARVSLVSLNEDKLTDFDVLYKQLKEIEFVKYRIFPDGCMIRLSPESSREQVRISKNAVREGLSFKNIGFGYIDEYKKDPAVKAATVIFVTEPRHDYKKLSAISTKAYAITQSLNKIFEGLEISCDTCNLKPICDEVEGLRKLHFNKEST